MIRVTANLAWIVPGRVGGSEEYSVRLLREGQAAASGSGMAIEVIASDAFAAAHPELTGYARLRGPLHVRPLRVLAEQVGVRRLSRAADVVHHFGGRVPAVRPRRAAHVVTVHDLQPVHHPENFDPIKRRYLGWAIPRSVAQADLVATPSDWVGQTIVDAYGVDPARVRTVPSTWDTHTTADPSLAARFGDRPLVLYPAVTHPHKNHEVLIRAMAVLAASVPEATLVLTGAAGAADAAVQRVIEETGAPVERLGRVDPASLLGLVSRADIVAFPSRYEGFGLPVLEAMRAGTPVVAGPAAAVAEVMAGTGTIVGEDDPHAWAEALTAALRRPPAAIDAARARAEHYAPAAAARRLLDVWRAAADLASTVR